MSNNRDYEVYTLDGKYVGRIVKMNSQYFTAIKNGIITNEEFRIPVSAIASIQNHIIKLDLNEDQVKHGHEFSGESSNSEFISGARDSELRVPFEKQTIRYEAVHPEESHGRSNKPLPVSQYLCDMCEKKFDNPSELQHHRGIKQGSDWYLKN